MPINAFKHQKPQDLQQGHSPIAADETTPDFRSKKRRVFSDICFWLRKLGMLPVMVPLVLAITGSMVSFSSDGGIASAIVTCVTVLICMLSIYVFKAVHTVRLPADKHMSRRFEMLEDRAWELQESEERYRAIAEVFGDALVMRNQSGAITFCNDAFMDLIGKAGENPKIVTRLPDEITKQVANISENKNDKMIQFQTSSGLRWYEWHDLSVRDEKTSSIGILSVARDVTSFRTSQQLDEAARKKAEEASHAKTRFLAMVSHEMRTPLNGVIGMSKLLSGTTLSPEQKNYSDALKTSGENLLSLIDGMLDLTMIESGRFEIKCQNFDLHKLLNEAVELLSSRAYLKGIDFGLYLDSALPRFLETDPGRLRQIIFNLAGNAIKFTNTGGVLIRCLLKEKQGKSFLRIEIIDTGPGLSHLDRDRIFQEFERVDNEITRTTDGAGLGLAISRALTLELGGSLELENSDASGSQFSLELPVVVDSKSSITNEKTESKSHGVEPNKILIISRAIQEPKALVEILRGQKFQVEWINTHEALEGLLLKKLPDHVAILFDPQNWPDPIQTIKKLKAAHSESCSLVILTLPDKKKDLKTYMDAGASAWLVRPVRQSSLFSLLRGHAKIKDEEINHLGSSSNEALAPNMITPIVESDAKSKCVLLAEDNDINALLVTAALKKRHIEVLRAHDGKQAIAIFTKANLDRKIDLILMDMHMPYCDGYSATAAIRKFETEKAINSNRAVPIFALTADEQIESKVKAKHAGVNGFLVKPIDPDKLCELVEHELEKTAKLDKLNT